MDFSSKQHPHFQSNREIFPPSQVVIAFVNCTSLELCVVPAFWIDVHWPWIKNNISQHAYIHFWVSEILLANSVSKY